VVITVDTTSIPDVILAVCFVFLVVAIFVATFYFGGAYIFSTIKERWHEYSTKHKIKVISRLVITTAVITVLLILSTQKLH
jgi:predicted metallopeptidase